MILDSPAFWWVIAFAWLVLLITGHLYFPKKKANLFFGLALVFAAVLTFGALRYLTA